MEISTENLEPQRIDWYRTPIDAQALGLLTKRSDRQGWLHIGGHLLLLTCTGTIAYLTYLHQLYLTALVMLLIHGTCYSFLGWAGAGHELVHRTVFKNKACNEFFLFLFAFLSWNNPIYFRASHIRHHQKTVFTAHDSEVRLPQTLRYTDWIWSLTFDVPAAYRALRIVIENSMGIIKGQWSSRLFTETMGAERRQIAIWARAVLLGHIALAAAFVLSGHWPLLLIITFAPFIADWLNKVLALAQHFGMQPNVCDYRDNSRTVLLHPALAFLYWQMNYHIEHHMYPGVPFFQLKNLRRQLEYDLPIASNGILPLLVEMALIKKRQAQSDALTQSTAQTDNLIQKGRP
ncbi:fatty acid desaturase [Herminiimonas arsenitoxidans]|uniref:fatty acid desaturase n=1 Tax=Herminiimonas arsenitoxidans TaxID=1809410 RepID=UPI00097049D8|nr:fatty acid desaturase [Herminiimonas arsenitoxidans]